MKRDDIGGDILIHLHISIEQAGITPKINFPCRRCSKYIFTFEHTRIQCLLHERQEHGQLAIAAEPRNYDVFVLPTKEVASGVFGRK